MTDPRAEYTKRLEQCGETIAAKDRLHFRLGNLKLLVVACGLLAAYLALAKHWFSAYWLLGLVAIYVALALAHELVLRAKARASSAAEYYRKGIARIDDRWTGTGQSGERFRVGAHVYAEDLDIFGPGSLFELLSTARLPMGENRLADWLTRPSPKAAVLSRQALVAELREKLDLRERMAVAGESLRPRLDPESLVSWGEHAPELPGNIWWAVCVLLTAAMIAGTVYWFSTAILWPLLLVLVLEGLLRRHFRSHAEAVVEKVDCNAEGLVLFANILKLLEQESFHSLHLQQLCAPLQADGELASQAIRRLASIVYWIDGRHSLLGHLVELPFLYTLQLGFAAETWRRHWGKHMRSWVNVAAEMEALLSLASYSFEHPADLFPEFVPESSAQENALFAGENLGHPLIAEVKCVRNSVRLDAETRVLLVSGSNMSGKSTLLRTIGINAVLAMAGAPVRAKSLRLTPLAVGTSIRRNDSLQEGRSGFYTEILQIRRVFELTEKPAPLLFLFDELLEGTNSKDRRIGADGLLKALLKRGAIGAVTTHDLALTEITASAGAMVRNMHFEDQVKDGKMAFDYRLREGVVAKSNAIELMRLMGFEI